MPPRLCNKHSKLSTLNRRRAKSLRNECSRRRLVSLSLSHIRRHRCSNIHRRSSIRQCSTLRKLNKKRRDRKQRNAKSNVRSKSLVSHMHRSNNSSSIVNPRSRSGTGSYLLRGVLDGIDKSMSIGKRFIAM